MPDKFLGPIEALMYIHAGCSTVTPYLFVKFLVSAFGGVGELRSLRPDGHGANVQVRVGTSTVMASEAGCRYPPCLQRSICTSRTRATP